MTRKHISHKFQVLSNSDSTTNPVASTVQDVRMADTVDYEFSIDAGVRGDFVVEYNNDKDSEYKAGSAVWKPINFGQALTVDGSVFTSGLINIRDNNFQRLRLSFADNGGAGNINAWFRAVSKGS